MDNENIRVPSSMSEKTRSLDNDSPIPDHVPDIEEAEKMIKDFNFEDEIKSRDDLAQSLQSDHDSSIAKGTENADKFIFLEAKKQIIMDRLHRASDFVEMGDLESALCEFNKILFYDKTIAEAYAERAVIYLRLCDFSSAIANFK
jgi:tetratricopeptide (TPR) repeat protein